MTVVANAERVVRQLSFIMPYIGGERRLIMVQDVVPALNERVQSSFKGYCLKDRRIAQVSKRIRDGTASFRDAHTYAESIGENLSRALVENLTESTLPDGKLYYNIAKRIVTPSLEENYNLVNDLSSEVQRIIDKTQGVGVNAIRADFPSDRISGLIDKMTADDITLERATSWLREPIVNNSEAFADDFIKANAEFRSGAGLKTIITRSVEFGCCEWCSALAGSYDYDKAPDEIYRRHEFCRCVVSYHSEKISQNVWTKKQWETSPEDIERRKESGNPERLTVNERISKIGQLERDKEIKNFLTQTGMTDRRYAREFTRRHDPDRIEKEIKRIQEIKRSIARG